MSINWVTLKERGNEEYKKKKYASAITFYTDGIKSDPNQDVLYSNRSLCYIAMKKYNYAIADLNRCININPRNIKALKRLANLQITLGNIGEAEIFYKSCITLEPKEVSHQEELKIIQVLMKNHEDIVKAKYVNDYKKCEGLGESILAKCIDFTKVKLIYIESLLKNCKIAEGIQFLKSRVTEDERAKNEEFNYFQALSMYYDGKYEKARQLVNALILKNQEKAKYTEFLNKLDSIEHEKDRATDCFKKGEYENAIFLYNKLLEIDKDNNCFNATIYANRALCYHKLNKFTEALTDINKSLKHNSNYMKAYLRRAQIQFKLKNFEEALIDFEKVKSIDPMNKDIYKLIDETKREIKKSKRKDYYKILELPKNATQEQIKKQFKHLSKKYHPDKNNGSDERMRNSENLFRDVNEAYKVLSDPIKKKLYDNGMNPDDADKNNFHFSHEEDLKFKDYFNEYMNQGNSENNNAENQHNESKSNKRKSKFDN